MVPILCIRTMRLRGPGQVTGYTQPMTLLNSRKLWEGEWMCLCPIWHEPVGSKMSASG